MRSPLLWVFVIVFGRVFVFALFMSMRNPRLWIFVIVFDGVFVFIYFSGLAISIIEGEESR